MASIFKKWNTPLAKHKCDHIVPREETQCGLPVSAVDRQRAAPFQLVQGLTFAACFTFLYRNGFVGIYMIWERGKVED